MQRSFGAHRKWQNIKVRSSSQSDLSSSTIWSVETRATSHNFGPLSSSTFFLLLFSSFSLFFPLNYYFSKKSQLLPLPPILFSASFLKLLSFITVFFCLLFSSFTSHYYLIFLLLFFFSFVRFPPLFRCELCPTQGVNYRCKASILACCLMQSV